MEFVRQAFHILKKDVRYLWLEVAGALAVLFTVFAVGEMRLDGNGKTAQNFGLARSVLEFLLPVAWAFLIARAIQAEALAGATQYWLTRPYQWPSILTAKTILVFLFLNLPLLIGQMLVLSHHGFTINQELPGILWTQVILTIGVVLPVAALATLTHHLVRLLMVMVGIVLAVSTVDYFVSQFQPQTSDWLRIEWVREACLLTSLALGASITIFVQYSRRNTKAAWLVIGLTFLLCWVGLHFLTWDSAYWLQSKISSQDSAAKNIQVRLEDDVRRLAVLGTEHGVSIKLAVELCDLPAGIEARVDGLQFHLAGPHDPACASAGPARELTRDGERGYANWCAIEYPAWKKLRGKPVKIRGSVFVTLLGDQHTTTFTADTLPVRIPGVGICSSFQNTVNALPPYVRCLNAFEPKRYSQMIRFKFPAGQPPTEMDSRSGVLGGGPGGISPPHNTWRSYRIGRQRNSYSPFPVDWNKAIAELIFPVREEDYFEVELGPKSFIAVEIETAAAIAHLRKDFGFRDVVLNDDTSVGPRGILKM